MPCTPNGVRSRLISRRLEASPPWRTAQIKKLMREPCMADAAHLFQPENLHFRGMGETGIPIPVAAKDP